MFRTLIGATIAASAAGQIQWQASNNIAVGRRLDAHGAHHQHDQQNTISLTSSNTNITDPDCIVGGFHNENPARIYVGGPCKDLQVETKDGVITQVNPTASFRWIEMETVHMEINDGHSKPAPFAMTPNTGFHVAKDNPNHAEVQCGSVFHLNVPKESRMGSAGLFASTTSYLLRADMAFNKNLFCVEATGEGNSKYCKTELTQCVAPCCAEPGAQGCSCPDTCPEDTKIQGTPGMYKYSIMAASFNSKHSLTNPTEEFSGGAGGNGWERIVAELGNQASIGEAKQLTGFMDVYQILDFTNMNIDVLEVVAPDGTSSQWKDMQDCDMTAANYEKNGYDCAAKEVGIKSMKVSSDGDWSAHYAFPTTQNVGSWQKVSEDTFTTTASATRTVQISAVKPSSATLTEWQWAKDVLEASRKKVLLVRYRFDIAGITAEGLSSGRFMNYDPTVTGPTGVNAPTPAPPAPAGGAAGGAGSGAGSNSTGTGGGAATGGTEASGAMTYSLAAVAFTLAAKMF